MRQSGRWLPQLDQGIRFLGVMGGAATPLPSFEPSDNGFRRAMFIRASEAYVSMKDRPDFGKAFLEFCSLICDPDVPQSVRKDFLRLENSARKFVAIEYEVGTASGAADSTLVFKASDFLISLLSTARAGNWAKVIILIHEGVAPTSVAQVG